ncbi:MAG: 30S ribosomal protein S12 methylthiotransferase RimO [Erysipelotrichaceae bacterium]|nr:30S ribosomal protein S12 methylthiotransferase RimO [Erysipelotrichaceae bacterium]
MNMKIGFVSLGCSKNLVDSENIMGYLRDQGHTITPDPAEAEVLFVNTCGFIQSAKEESLNTILEMAEYKSQNCKKLIVTGCLAQRYLTDLQKELPEVDRFITIDEYDHIAEILEEELNGVTKPCEHTRLLSTKPWFAYLRIADGCDNRCAYCAIPLIRHDYRSVPMEELLKEAEYLAKQGVKELNLIAQDTSRYGIDLYGKHRLLDLLTELNRIEGFHWIRVLYLYPDEISDELVVGMSELNKVVPYFDIPIQYGNDRMLKLMNRRGTIAEIKHTIGLIRSTFAHSVIRTTMIVGFPTETAKDFQDLLDFVEEMRFDRMGAFTYSLEEDTPSYDMRPRVSRKVMDRRMGQLMELQQKIAQQNSEALVDEVLEVLIESHDGLTEQYRGRSIYSAPDGIDGIVKFKPLKKHNPGEFVKVKIRKASMHDLIGVETE